MHLSFEITFEYEGKTITAVATPTQYEDSVVYDVNYQGKVISIEARPSDENYIIWQQHLTGATNDLIQKIGEAIEHAEM